MTTQLLICRFFFLSKNDDNDNNDNNTGGGVVMVALKATPAATTRQQHDTNNGTPPAQSGQPPTGTNPQASTTNNYSYSHSSSHHACGCGCPALLAMVTATVTVRTRHHHHTHPSPLEHRKMEETGKTGENWVQHQKTGGNEEITVLVLMLVPNHSRWITASPVVCRPHRRKSGKSTRYIPLPSARHLKESNYQTLSTAFDCIPACLTQKGGGVTPPPYLVAPQISTPPGPTEQSAKN